MKLKNLSVLLLVGFVLTCASSSHAISVLIKKGQAGSGAASTAIALLLVDSATGQTGQAGLAASSTKTVELPGATSYITATGTLVDTGGGAYDYFPAASETVATGVLKLRVTGSGIQNNDTSAQIVGFDPTDGTLLGLTGVGTLSNQAGIKAKTDLLATNGMDSPNTITAQGQAGTTSTAVAGLSAATLAVIKSDSQFSILLNRQKQRFIYVPSTHSYQPLLDDGTTVFGSPLILTVDSSGNILQR